MTLTVEHGEERFAKELVRHGAKDIIRSHGYFPDWDIGCDKGTYEIKEDVAAQRTGRLFVELKYRGELSGLAATKADWFVFIVKNTAYFSRSVHWKSFLRDNWKYLNKTLGGDNNWSEGVLVPMDYVTSSHICGLEAWEIEPLEK